jgi:hypothetical protein
MTESSLIETLAEAIPKVAPAVPMSNSANALTQGVRIKVGTQQKRGKLWAEVSKMVMAIPLP